jgi:hypothetical protein
MPALMASTVALPLTESMVWSMIASVRITRRELLTVIGAAVAAGCRGSSTPANRTDQPAKVAGPQPAEPATVTLVVSGMI